MPERLQDRLQQRPGLVVGLAVDRRLRLLVGELCSAFHHHAVECVADLAAFLGKDHAHGKRRTVFTLAQRAEIVGNPLRQHRHDAVGEIDGIAALQRLAVERSTGPDIPGDISNRDGDDHAIRIVGRGVKLGIDRVVMVLRIGRIDGDQRYLAPVLAMRHRRGLGRFRSLHHVLREDMRNAMRIDGDHRDRLFRGNRTDDRQNLGPRQAVTAGADDFRLDQIAVLGLADIGGLDHHFLAAPVGRQKTDFSVGDRLDHAERRILALVENLQHTRRIGRPGTILVRKNLCQDPVVDAGGRRLALRPVVGILADQHGRCRTRIIRPFRRTADQIAVLVAGGDVENGDGRKGARPRQRLAALL